MVQVSNWQILTLAWCLLLEPLHYSGGNVHFAPSV
jgi:hypothetical protein